MQALGVIHKITNMFTWAGTKLRQTLSEEDVVKIKIIDKEGNPFFKNAAKRLKANKTLKRKTVPFSESRPIKRHKIAIP